MKRKTDRKTETEDGKAPDVDGKLRDYGKALCWSGLALRNFMYETNQTQVREKSRKLDSAGLPQ